MSKLFLVELVEISPLVPAASSGPIILICERGNIVMSRFIKTVRSVERKAVGWMKTKRAIPAIRRTGFWFIDIPRTGSSALRAELSHYFGAAYGKENVNERRFRSRQLMPDHLTAREMRTLVSPAIWDNLFTFSFVRNPFDRILSLYRYRSEVGKIPDHWSFCEFVARMVEADNDTPYFQYPPVRMAASDFLVDNEGTVLVNKIFRFENREAELKKIADRIKIESFANLKAQSTKKNDKDYRKAYEDKTRELVELHSKRDLKLFEYEF